MIINPKKTRKMKSVIKLNERDLHSLINEVISEIGNYRTTMANAEKKYGVNDNDANVLQRMRGKINPQKRDQLRRLQNVGTKASQAPQLISRNYDVMTTNSTINSGNDIDKFNGNFQVNDYLTNNGIQPTGNYNSDMNLARAHANKYARPMNESRLQQLIMNTIKQVLNEETDYASVWGDENFDSMNQANDVNSGERRFIENPVKFAQQLGQNHASKYNRINARPANGVEHLTTYKQDPSIAGYGPDNIETQNNFSNGMVANNVNTPWQKYGIDQKTFDKKYELDPNNKSQYRPKGGPMNASQVQDNVAFPNPWGQGNMNVDKGGYMMQDINNPNDTYGIQKDDFDSTYKFDK